MIAIRIVDGAYCVQALLPVRVLHASTRRPELEIDLTQLADLETDNISRTLAALARFAHTRRQRT